MKSNLTVINISGPDHPGITARLMQCLENHQVKLYDIGQNVTYELLSLSYVIKVIPGSNVLKDLLFEATEMGMKMDYKEVERLGKAPHTESYIISCVSPEIIPPTFMKEIASLLARHEINIKRMDSLQPKAFHSVDFQVDVLTDKCDIDQVKQGLLALSHTHSLDLAMI